MCFTIITDSNVDNDEIKTYRVDGSLASYQLEEKLSYALCT